MTGEAPYRGRLDSPDATLRFGRALARHCAGGERIALVGELGAGKTTLMRGFAEGLGLDPREISSPTFTLVHVHECPGPVRRLVHGDAYRLESTDELEGIGWQEHLEDPAAVVVLEWPDRVPGALGPHPLVVELVHDEPDGQGRPGRMVYCSDAGFTTSLREGRDTCRTCRKPVPAEEPHGPFCSDRCRMADLGSWFAGDYSISREIEEDDLMDPDVG